MEELEMYDSFVHFQFVFHPRMFSLARFTAFTVWPNCTVILDRAGPVRARVCHG